MWCKRIRQQSRTFGIQLPIIQYNEHQIVLCSLASVERKVDTTLSAISSQLTFIPAWNVSKVQWKYKRKFEMCINSNDCIFTREFRNGTIWINCHLFNGIHSCGTYYQQTHWFRFHFCGHQMSWPINQNEKHEERHNQIWIFIGINDVCDCPNELQITAYRLA